MRRQHLIYPEHPCLRCRKMTKGKTYDDDCLRIITQPYYLATPKLSISADFDGRIGRRNESTGEKKWR